MKKIFLIVLVQSIIAIGLFAQVGINTNTPNAKSALDITSTSKGLLPPRLTEAQRDAIADPVPAGLQVWCNNCGPNGEMQVYDGLSWTNLAGVPAVPGPFTCGTSKVSFQYNGTPVKYGTVVSAGGRCWLDRNLGASRVATDIGDAQAYGDLFQWGRGADKHQKRNPLSITTTILSSGDTPDHGKFIINNGGNYDWRSPQNDNLWSGVTGANNPCPPGFRLPTDVEWDIERQSWSSNNRIGAFNSSLKLPSAGTRSQTGALALEGVSGRYFSSTVDGVYNRELTFSSSNASIDLIYRVLGSSVRCIKDTNYPGSIGSLDCSGASIDGTLTDGIAATGVSADISYTNGNGATHTGQTVLSSGVSGLTATLTAGTFASGAGSLTYTITGTPATDGTAEFALNIGGQNCTLSIPVASASFTCGTSTVTFTYRGSPVTYGTVVGAGNRCWLDRNLGASQIATSSTDAAAYGDLFQWGRGADGHQVRNPLSGTTSTLSNTDSPPHANFIKVPSSPNDWRSPQNNNLWQGVNGANNPCPTGYRVPTALELYNEAVSWGGNQNALGAFNSPLKLPVAGSREGDFDLLFSVGTVGRYWSSTVIGTSAYGCLFNSSIANILTINRANGYCVRCIKD